MKTLFIVNDFPPILGGQSLYLYNLCQSLASDSLVVLAPKISGCENFDKAQNFKIIRKPYLFPIPLLGKLLKIVFAFFFTLSLLKKEQITQLHCPHVLSVGLIGLVLKKLKKIPYYTYSYGADILEFQKYTLIKKLLRIILIEAERVITISEYTKGRLLELKVPEDKIIKIYPRIDLKLYHSSSKDKSALGKYGLAGKRIILSVNRLVERKGNDIVIQAMADIKNNFSDVVYVAIGDGPFKEKLKKLAAVLKVEDRIFFLGKLSDPEVRIFYSCCELFIMLSREIPGKGDVEGFGMVFLEANAYGKPVIGGDSGGVKDAIIHGVTGLLINPSEVDKVSDNIVKLLNDKKYAAILGENGRRRVREEFDLNKGIEEFKAIF